MEQLVEYGDRVGHSIKEAVILEEISQLAYDDLTDKQNSFTSVAKLLQYAPCSIARVRPEIESALVTLWALKSRKHLDQMPAKKWRPKNSVSTWTHSCRCTGRQDAYVKQHCLNSKHHTMEAMFLVLASILSYTQRSTTHMGLLTPQLGELISINFKKHIKRGAIAGYSNYERFRMFAGAAEIVYLNPSIKRLEQIKTYSDNLMKSTTQTVT